ncbi:MAG: tetratricopeptide repeat protein [Clostridiaceae bacterium]
MTYSLGADPLFKYAVEYILILKKYERAVPIVKQKISELVKDKRMVDAFILLSGLYEAIGEEDIENALLTIGEELVIGDQSYSDNVLDLADKAIENGNNTGRLIKGSIYRLLGKPDKALRSFTEYIKLGGEVSDELSAEMEAMTRNTVLDEGYSLIFEKPEEALKQLLPMYKSESNNPRYLYSIAVAYRNLENYDKAIYYLEEARAIDSGYIDVLNELGLNYSMLNDYTTAEKYFRAVYEASMDLGPLTNLIISLFNLKRNEEAYKLYLTALKKAPEDEILREIKKFYIDGK